jgi:ribosomal protein S18 acetylase RimI-like enzyme
LRRSNSRVRRASDDLNVLGDVVKRAFIAHDCEDTAALDLRLDLEVHLQVVTVGPDQRCNGIADACAREAGTVVP